MERPACSTTEQPSTRTGRASGRSVRTSKISQETCESRERSRSEHSSNRRSDRRMERYTMRQTNVRAELEGGRMITTRNPWSVFFPPVAAIVIAFLFLTMPARAQNVQVDLSSTSALCGGQECFNTAGIFTNGTTFLGTSGMDNGNNCTPTPPYTNCPDAYSAQQLFGTAFSASSTTPPMLTLGSVPFTFGTVNTASCGSTGTACINDVVQFKTNGVAITLPAAQQVVYSTLIMLGTAVNGHHSGTVTATYTDSTTNV